MPHELPHEKHNRIAGELAKTIVHEFAPIDRMIVLESIASAVIGTLPYSEGGREDGTKEAWILLSEGLRARLNVRLDT